MSGRKDLEAAAAQLAGINSAIDTYARLKEKLDLLNKYGKHNGVWQPTLLLREGDRYGKPEVTQRFTIPFGVIQQQLVNEVSAARRLIISLGGEVP